ncbi:MAG: 50S ribosomal protein L28 [Candidatus Poribacteria bacterium]|nr:50S ribosomal protein L28 [Candidatus Poribacteria bacterium]
MARICYTCGKIPMAGNRISKSRRHTKRRWLPNLQRVRIQTENGNRRVRVCTRCIRSGRVIKAVSGGQQVAYGN